MLYSWIWNTVFGYHVESIQTLLGPYCNTVHVESKTKSKDTHHRAPVFCVYAWDSYSYVLVTILDWSEQCNVLFSVRVLCAGSGIPSRGIWNTACPYFQAHATYSPGHCLEMILVAPCYYMWVFMHLSLKTVELFQIKHRGAGRIMSFDRELV